MLAGMRARLQRWWRHALATTRRRWWVWLFLIPLRVIESRIVSAANSFIDAHREGALRFAARFLVWLSRNPLGLTGLLGVLLLLGLLVHAYVSSVAEARSLRAAPLQRPVFFLSHGFYWELTHNFWPMARTFSADQVHISHGMIGPLCPNPECKLDVRDELLAHRLACPRCATVLACAGTPAEARAVVSVASQGVPQPRCRAPLVR